MAFATLVLLAALSAIALPPSRAQKPCPVNSICFAMDGSLSISKPNFAELKQAVTLLAGEIDSRTIDTTFAAARFSGFRHRTNPNRNNGYAALLTVQEPTTARLAEFNPSVAGVGLAPAPNFWTFQGAGLKRCRDLIVGQPGNRVIVLLTDGDDTVVTEDPDSADIADSIKAEGLRIATVGIGNVNANILRGLASNPAFFVATSFGTIVSDVAKITDDACEAGGHGDPHVTGFDGSRFDFHGEHGKRFAMFGRKGGDLVVATIHAATDEGTDGAVRRTYFREFGITPAGSKSRVRIAMLPCPVRHGEWVVGAEVDGMAISSTWQGDNLSVEFATASRLVVRTAEVDYYIKMMWPQRKNTAHLNFNVDLKRVPKKGDRFHGVLGMTLNPVVGLEKDSDYLPGTRAELREASLRRRFGVSVLFPAWDNISIDNDVQKIARPNSVVATSK